MPPKETPKRDAAPAATAPPPILESLGIEERPGVGTQRLWVAVLVRRQGDKLVSVEELQRPTNAPGANDQFKIAAQQRVLR